jgi:biopolymer transport protein ExbD
MRKILLIAALAAAAFFLVSVHPAAPRPRSMGLEVKIALATPCKAEVVSGEMVQVLRPGTVRLNSEELTLKELDHRLEAIFRNKTQHVVLLSGGGDLPFSDVVAVLEVAARYADYIALVTPAVEHATMPQSGNCFDPNITFPQIVM